VDTETTSDMLDTGECAMEAEFEGNRSFVEVDVADNVSKESSALGSECSTMKTLTKKLI